MTTLEIVLDYMNWQGGTIHQVKDQFKRLNEGERDYICSRLIEKLADIQDPKTAAWFFKERNAALGIVVRS